MLNSQQLFPVVLTVDPAIDTKRMDSIDPLIEYARTRDFNKIVPYLDPSKAAMVFHLKPITRSQMARVMAAASAYDRQVLAFRFSVARVDNLVTSDGAVIDPWRPASVNIAKPEEPTALTDAELDMFAHNEIAEIGAVAETLSFLGPRYERAYELPDGLRATLIRRFSHLAEPSPAAENSSEASTSSQSAQSTSSSNGGP